MLNGKVRGYRESVAAFQDVEVHAGARLRQNKNQEHQLIKLAVIFIIPHHPSCVPIKTPGSFDATKTPVVR
jgi:hypothetical protein